MYKISLDAVFGIFDDLQNLLTDNLLEISVKKSRINFEFEEGNLIHSGVISSLFKDSLISEESLYMTSLNDNIRVTCDTDGKTIPEDSMFKEYFNLIDELGEHICQCPALEYVVSENFLKIFIDKPNIPLNDLKSISKIFGVSFSVELQKQRPYCLFIRQDGSKNTLKDKDIVTNVTFNPTVLTSDMVRKI